MMGPDAFQHFNRYHIRIPIFGDLALIKIDLTTYGTEYDIRGQHMIEMPRGRKGAVSTPL
jgi:hypothetical protein